MFHLNIEKYNLMYPINNYILIQLHQLIELQNCSYLMKQVGFEPHLFLEQHL